MWPLKRLGAKGERVRENTICVILWLEIPVYFHADRLNYYFRVFRLSNIVDTVNSHITQM